MCFCCRVFYRYSTQNVGTTTAQQSPKVVKLEQSKNIQRRQLRHLTKCYEHQWSLSWVFASNAWQELRWLLAWTFLGLCSCSSRDFLLSKSQETQADAFQWPSALSFRCFFAKAPYNWIAYMDRWIRFHTAFLFGNDRTLYSKMTAYDSRKLSQLFTPGDRCIFPVRPLQKPKEMGIGANKSRKFLGRRSFCGCHLWWFEFRSIVWYCNCVCSFLQCLVFERYTQRFTTSQLYVSECKCEMSYILLFYWTHMSRPVARSAPWDAPCLGMLQIVTGDNWFSWEFCLETLNSSTCGTPDITRQYIDQVCCQTRG